MNLANLVVVLVRLYGLLLLFNCIGSVEGGLVALYSAPRAADPNAFLWTNGVLFLANAVLDVLAGFCFLISAPGIASRVTPETASDATGPSVSATDLALVSFSLAGIFFLVEGAHWLVHDGALWYLSPPPRDFKAIFDMRMTATSITSAFKMLVGLCLLFGPRGLVKAIRWTRQAGISRPVLDGIDEHSDKAKE